MKKVPSTVNMACKMLVIIMPICILKVSISAIFKISTSPSIFQVYLLQTNIIIAMKFIWRHVNIHGPSLLWGLTGIIQVIYI